MWRDFWQLFGASNQLLAALTLLGVTVWLWRTQRNPLVWLVTGVPTVVMYTMSTWALVAMTLPEVLQRGDGEFTRRPTRCRGRRRADRAGGADARRSGAGDCRRPESAVVVEAGAGDVMLE